MLYVIIKSDPELGVGRSEGKDIQQDSKPSWEVVFKTGSKGLFYRDDIEVLDPRQYQTQTQLRLVSEDSNNGNGTPYPPYGGDF